MTPDERKRLIAAKLGQLLREGTLEASEDEVATDLMDRGLWDTMAPLIDSVALIDRVAEVVGGFRGRMLTPTAAAELLLQLGEVADSLSDSVVKPPVRGRSHNSSVGAWGGRVIVEGGGEG